MPTIFSSELQELSSPQLPSKSPSRHRPPSLSMRSDATRPRAAANGQNPTLAQARESRRTVMAQVRNDWTFPPPARSTKDPALAPSPTPPTFSPQRRSLKDVLRGIDNNQQDMARASIDQLDPATDQEGNELDGLYQIENDRVMSWHERNYASSDPSSDEDDEDMFRSPLSPGKPPAGRSPSATSLGSRKVKLKRSFMNGLRIDTTGASNGQIEPDEAKKEQILQQKKIERKERRRRRLEEEIKWNDGLAFWVAQRDAWCCARKVPATVSKRKPTVGDARGLKEDHSSGSVEPSSVEPEADGSAGGRSLTLSSGTTLVPSRPVTPPYHTSENHFQSTNVSTAHTYAFSPSYGAHTPRTPPAINNDTSLTTEEIAQDHAAASLHLSPLPNDFPDPYMSTLSRSAGTRVVSNTKTILPKTLPILLPSDPTRASIRPSLYPSIYSKVIIQSLTPSIPINLGVLVPALVDGWKRDGEWPAPSPQPDLKPDPKDTNSPFDKLRREDASANGACPIDKGLGLGRRLLGSPNTTSESGTTRGEKPLASPTSPKSAHQEPFPSLSLNNHSARTAQNSEHQKLQSQDQPDTSKQDHVPSGDADQPDQENDQEHEHGHFGVRRGVKRVGRRLRESLSAGSGGGSGHSNLSNSGLSSLGGDEREN